MKQFFQIMRGILLALLLFEVLVWAGSRLPFVRMLIGAFPVLIGALVLLLCLYLTFIRKGSAAGSPDRREYLVTMTPDAYGHIGSVFEPEKYGNPERLPGGLLEGVRTYRAEDGSLLFTVRQYSSVLRGRSRLLCAVLVTAALLGPLSALSYVNAANRSVGQMLSNVGLTVHPNAMSYLPVRSVDLPWSSSGSSDTPEDTAQQHGDDTAADSVQPDTSAPVSAAPEREDAPSDSTPSSDSSQTPLDRAADAASGAFGAVRGWFSGVGNQVSGLFFGGRNDILPSDRRVLTQSDVAGMSAAEIQRAINELYARHGYDLSNSSDADYFAAQDWYEPDSSLSQDEVRAQFSETENKNLDFLIDCRSRLRQ